MEVVQLERVDGKHQAGLEQGSLPDPLPFMRLWEGGLFAEPRPTKVSQGPPGAGKLQEIGQLGTAESLCARAASSPACS